MYFRLRLRLVIEHLSKYSLQATPEQSEGLITKQTTVFLLIKQP
jgi:hypothetical protein